MMLLVDAMAGFTLGLAGGALFFRALRRNTVLYLAPGPAWRPLALHALRMLLLGGLLVGSVMAGGAAGLLATFAGVLAARAIALRGARGAAR